MKARQIEKIGIPRGKLAKLAKWLASEARQSGLDTKTVWATLEAIVADPAAHRDDPHFAPLAKALDQRQRAVANVERGHIARSEPAPWKQWGTDIDAQAIEQVRNACELPISVRAALMPDAHLGYGLPIGGVLATDNAVIPYAVGVDIACRVKISVLDIPPAKLDNQPERFRSAIKHETRFGIGAQFKGCRRQHDVMDEDWSITRLTGQLKDKAWSQLGTSGSGNHFVEFGTLNVDQMNELNLEPGEYLALLSHSGSRGTGAEVCRYYSTVARNLHPELPKHLQHLAWLTLDSAEGREYWAAMNLMGRYAAANHALIHRHIAEHLGAQVLADVENHHNFAWKETHDGREVIVHRKGATPAGKGVLGIIPGSMAGACYVVRGKGSEEALQSSAHGAGRVMSRTQAKKTYKWPQIRDYLKQHHVELVSAGLDEAPFVYRDIDQVMAAQKDLVEPIARFFPRLVKMAPAGERAED